MALLAATTPVLFQAAPASAAATQDVTFHGYRISVPNSWRVVDLTSNPKACVRFDRHVVYLGHPGDTPACPTRLVGRTEALLVEPLDQSSAARVNARTVRPPSGQVAVPHLPETVGHELTVAVERAGVLVTASYGDDHATVAGILAGATLAAGASPSTADSQSQVSPQATSPVVQPGTFAGEGFDACDAPSSSTMAAWMASSPYRAVGIYIGGVSRTCGVQPNLTASWVSEQVAAGWHLIPTYVGLQAPCTTFTNRIDPANAASQGTAAADDAVAQAQLLGIGAGSTIVDDMEAYTTTSSCRTAVLSFLNAWTTRLHEQGYTSAVYSSAFGAFPDLESVYNATSFIRPDYIWFARYNGVVSLSDSSIPDDEWADHQRMRQYQGGHDETFGGVTINIDNDLLDVVPRTPSTFPAVRQTASAVVGDTIHLFAQGGTGELLDSTFEPTTGWSDWAEHPGVTVAGGPSVLVEDQDIHVFVRGTDGQAYQMDFQPSTGWSGWTSLGGTLAGDPTPVLYGDEIHLFARAADGAMDEAVFTPTTGWSGWTSHGGVLAGDPSVLVYASNQIHLFARATSGAIYQLFFTPTAGWSTWIKLGGVLAGDPSAIVYAGNQIHIFARSTNTAIYQLRYIPGSGWLAWLKLGGTLAGDPTTLGLAGNQIEMVAQATDGSVNELRYVPGVGWSPWTGLGGVVTGDPSLVQYGTGLQMFDFGTNDRVYGDSFDPVAGWSGWASPLQ